MKQQFFTLDVLSAYSGKLMGDLDGLYKVLSYLTNDQLMTHQLPRAIQECHCWLEKQLPFLKEIDVSGVTLETYKIISQGIVAQYGKLVEIEPLPEGEHQFKHPIEEAVEIFGEEKIIVVDV